MIRRASVFLALFSTLSLAAVSLPTRRPAPLDPDVLRIEGATSSSGPAVPLRGMAADPEGRWLYATSPDGLRLLKIEGATGRVERSSALLTAASRVVGSPDGRRLAVVSSVGSTVLLVDVTDLSVASTLVTDTQPAAAVFSADGLTLYVACASGRSLQAFDVVSALLVKGTSLPEAPADAVLMSGAQLAVAAPTAGRILVYDGETLEPAGSVAVAPGTSMLAHRDGPDKDVLLTSSETADLVTLIDAGTLEILKILPMTDPGAAQALGSLGLVSKQHAKIVALEADPYDAAFGEARTTAFLAGGADLVVTAVDSVFAADAARTTVTRLPVAAVQDGSTTDSVLPAKGVPGSRVFVSGRYPDGTSAVFQREEQFGARAAAENLTATFFDTEIPLSTPLGTNQLWVSRSSAEAIDAHSFVASSPFDVEVVGTLEGIEELIRDLERLASDPSLAAEAVERLRAALDALRRALQLLLDGQFREGLLALADTFHVLEQAGASGAPIGSASRQMAELVQYAVFSKLEPVRSQLGDKNSDVKEALRRFADARVHLRAGRLRDAIAGYLGTFDALEAGIANARRLRPAQALTILRDAADVLSRARNLTHNHVVSDHGTHLVGGTAVNGDVQGHHGGHALTGTPLHRVIAHLGPVGILDGTALGYLSKFRPRESILEVRKAVVELSTAGQEGEYLSEMLCHGMQRMVVAIADAVESNVGPHDAVIVRARRFLAECAQHEASEDHLAGLDALDAAMGGHLENTARTSQMSLFQATSTDTSECHPSVRVSKIEPLCVDHATQMITPNPLKFDVAVGSEPPGAGQLLVSIHRAKGMQLIKQYPVRNVPAPSLQSYTWDGKDESGQIVPLKGGPNGVKQEDMVVQAEFICFTSEGSSFHSDPDLEEFTVVAHGGLIVKPNPARKCAARPGHEVEQQFTAHLCRDGAIQDVTNECTWTLDKPSLGEIGANTGLFKAKQGAAGAGKVEAVLKDPPARGHAKLVLTPEGGGIVEPFVDLCVNGTYDFDIHRGCDENENSVPQNDQDYQWFVSDASKGSITASGLFRALAKGDVIVTAISPDGERQYQAKVHISDIDSIEVVFAPPILCAHGDASEFVVQVFCNAMPKEGVTVAFSAEERTAAGTGASGSVTVLSATDVSDAAGFASTDVASGQPPQVSTSPGSTRLVARAQDVETQAAITVVSEEVALTAPNKLCVGQKGAVQVAVTCAGLPVGDVPVTLSSSGGILFEGSAVLTKVAIGGLLTVEITATSPSTGPNGTMITATSGDGTAVAFVHVHPVEMAILEAPDHLCMPEGGTVRLSLTCDGEPAPGTVAVTMTASDDAFGAIPQTVIASGGIAQFFLQPVNPSRISTGTVLTFSAPGSTVTHRVLVVYLFVTRTGPFFPLGKAVMQVVAAPSGLGQVEFSSASTGRGAVEFSDDGGGYSAQFAVPPSGEPRDVHMRGAKTSHAKSDVTIRVRYGPCSADWKTTIGSQLEWDMPEFKPLLDAGTEHSPAWDVVFSAKLMNEDRSPLAGKRCHVFLDEPENADWTFVGAASDPSSLPTIAQDGSVSGPGVREAVTSGDGRIYIRLKRIAEGQTAPKRVRFLRVAIEEYGDPYKDFDPQNGSPLNWDQIGLTGGSPYVPEAVSLTRDGVSGLIQPAPFDPDDFELVTWYEASLLSVTAQDLVIEGLEALLRSVFGEPAYKELKDVLVNSGFDQRKAVISLATFLFGFTRGIETAAKDSLEFFAALPGGTVNFFKYISNTVGVELANEIFSKDGDLLGGLKRGLAVVKGDVAQKLKTFFDGISQSIEQIKQTIPQIAANKDAFIVGVGQMIFEDSFNNTVLTAMTTLIGVPEAEKEEYTKIIAVSFVAGGVTAVAVTFVVDPVANLAPKFIAGFGKALKDILNTVGLGKDAALKVTRGLSFIARGIRGQLFASGDPKNKAAVLKVFSNLVDGLEAKHVAKLSELDAGTPEGIAARDRYVKLMDRLRGLDARDKVLPAGKIVDSYSEAFAKGMKTLEEEVTLPVIGKRNIPQSTMLAMQGVLDPNGREFVIKQERIEHATRGVGRLLQTESPNGVRIHEEFLGINPRTGTKVDPPGPGKTAGIPQQEGDRLLYRLGLFQEASAAQDLAVAMKRLFGARSNGGDARFAVQDAVEMYASFMTRNATAPFDVTTQVDKVADLERVLKALSKEQWYNSGSVRGFWAGSAADGSVDIKAKRYFLKSLLEQNNKGYMYHLAVVDQRLPVSNVPGDFMEFERVISFADPGTKKPVKLEVDMYVDAAVGAERLKVGHEFKVGLLDADRETMDQMLRIQRSLEAGALDDYIVWLNKGMTPRMQQWMQANAPRVAVENLPLME